MNAVRMWMAALAAVCVVGCANGGVSTGPSPLAFGTPTVPSSCAVPNTPGGLSASVDGDSVTLSWSPVADAADYVVLVGDSPTTSETLFTNTTAAHHDLDSMEPGTHYARVHAHNWCGTSDASRTLEFTIGE